MADDRDPFGASARPARLRSGSVDLRWSSGLGIVVELPAADWPAPRWEGLGQDASKAGGPAARDHGGALPPGADGVSVADGLPAGPALAAWLADRDPESALDLDVIAMAAAFRRLASWAQAGELTMVAQVAARSAARDPKAGLGPAGRPAYVTRDAAAQVSLELVLSRPGAEAWTELAVTLAWRLPATAAALAAGQIDLVRARIMAEAVAPLSDEAAAAVEAAVLPRAGDLTYTQLGAAVRRAVIAADPDGAEQRRRAAERRAKVSLYPDQDCTATLVGTRLPAAHAAAAMARLSALARAMKAAGHGGGLDLLRAQAYLGLLLGTLPLIPPPADGPPDADPPSADGHGDGTPPSGHDDGPPGHDAGPPGADDRAASGGPDHRDPPAGHDSRPSGGDGPGATGTSRPPGPDDGDSPGSRQRGEGPGGRSNREPTVGDDARQPGSGADGPPGAGLPAAGPWTDAPPLTDADLPPDDGWRDIAPPVPSGYADMDPDRGDPLDDHFADAGTLPPWPPAPSAVRATQDISPAGPPPTDGGRPPPGGLLDVVLPWSTLTGEAEAPGTLGRLGPVTAPAARQLARLGARNRATEWRVILTDRRGRAIAVGRVPRRARTRAGPAGSQRAGPAEPDRPSGDLWPTVGRVTVVMSVGSLESLLDGWVPGPGSRAGGISHPGETGLPGADKPPSWDQLPSRDEPMSRDELPSWAELPSRSELPSRGGLVGGRELADMGERVLAAASRAWAAARREAEADRRAPGGCAHASASAAYRPPPRIREFVIARDQTCRNPRCGQPAWRADLDHTRPHHRGGLTCKCNLGGACRGDHQLKQLPGWSLTQPEPGVFVWTTPAGRSYTTRPDQHYDG